jgi:hypothetical protein
MTCPHCQKRISDRAVVSAAARIIHRGVANPGRPPVLRKCAKCGQKHSAREMRRCKG